MSESPEAHTGDLPINGAQDADNVQETSAVPSLKISLLSRTSSMRRSKLPTTPRLRRRRRSASLQLLNQSRRLMQSKPCVLKPLPPFRNSKSKSAIRPKDRQKPATWLPTCCV